MLRCGEYWDLYFSWMRAENDKAERLAGRNQAIFLELVQHGRNCPICCEGWAQDKARMKNGVLGDVEAPEGQDRDKSG